MATVEECEQAVHGLADLLAGVDEGARRASVPDRTLSCQIRDLDVIFAGAFRDGHLHDIRRVDRPDAQIRLSVGGDDLLRLTRGELKFVRAWATGRVRVDASLPDLLRLRALL